METVLPLSFELSRRHAERVGQTVCANRFQLGLLGWVVFWGWKQTPHTAPTPKPPRQSKNILETSTAPLAGMCQESTCHCPQRGRQSLQSRRHSKSQCSPELASESDLAQSTASWILRHKAFHRAVMRLKQRLDPKDPAVLKMVRHSRFTMHSKFTIAQ